MIGRILFRFIRPHLELWWVDKILAYHEGLVERQQIGSPIQPLIKASAEIVDFPQKDPP